MAMSAKAAMLLALVVAGAMLIGLQSGATWIAPDAVIAGLSDPLAPGAAIVRGLRLPRVLLAFLVGGSLAVTGAALQALVRNPLADPYLLGISGGAGLGAVIAMSLGLGGVFAVPLAAFTGALAAVGVVYRLSAVGGRPLDTNVLLLSGVVIGAFTGAVMSGILAVSDASQLRSAVNWLLGGFGSAGWSTVMAFAGYAALPLAVLWSTGRALDLLTLGDEPALHLGADVERTKRVAYFCASLLTAASVAACGIVGFVGLVVPHAIRRVATPLHRALLPMAFLAGGSFLVLADAAARTVVRPIELPVGVVTALVGVPVFAGLLRKTLR
jgi:iron complex transport system permease protein